MKAMRANRVVSIPEQQKEMYLQNGWIIMDDNEKIIAKPKTGEAELKTEIEALKVLNNEKDREIQALQAEIADLTKKLSAAEKGKKGKDADNGEK